MPTTSGTADGYLHCSRTPALSRRRWLQLGALGVLGVGLPDLLAAQARLQPVGHAAGFGQARSCVLLFMWGGPSHLDTWDPKPEAPAEVRGEFRPIATSIAGTQISEYFPLLAQRAHRYAILRSLTHDDAAHLSSVHHVMTGRYAPRVRSDANPPSRRDSPHVGSVLALLRPTHSAVPPFVTLPWIVSHPAAPGGKAPGQNAGWLGPSYDPLVISGDPAAPDFGVGSGFSHTPEVSAGRLQGRRALLEQIDGATGPASVWQERALDLLSSPAAQQAFEVGREPAAVRDRYGRHSHGQSVLLARRLIEAGVRLVCVNWPNDNQFFWDTHTNNFNSLRDRLMPPPTVPSRRSWMTCTSAAFWKRRWSCGWVSSGGRRASPRRPAAITGRHATRRCWPAAASAAARCTAAATAWAPSPLRTPLRLTT